MAEWSSQAEQLREEIQEIAEVLLREKPPGTTLMEVWAEAISLHRVRYSSVVLPPREDNSR